MSQFDPGNIRASLQMEASVVVEATQDHRATLLGGF